MQNDTQNMLPDNVLDFLSDFEAVRFAQGFVKTYSLTEDDVSRVMSLAEDVVYGDVAVDTLPAEMVSRFGLTEAVAKQAALELATARLLPVQQVVPNVSEWVKRWGGEMEVSQKKETDERSPEAFVQTALQEVLKEMPSQLRGRLAHILELFVSKHSDKALVLGMLTRSEKLGGVAFEQKDAEELLAYVERKLEGVSVKTEVRPEIGEVDALTPALPAQTESVLREEEDAAEIAEIMVNKQAAMETPKTEPVTVEEMVQQICALPVMQVPDAALSDRCRQLVDARLRDVRTAADTQKLIERDVASGGLALSGRASADMMQAIERGYDALRTHAQEKMVQEKQIFVEKQQAKEGYKQELAAAEEKNLTKRYVAMTGKMPDAHVSPVGPSNARVSAATSKEDVLERHAQQVDTTKVRTVIEAVKQADGTVKAPAPAQKPVMRDVTFAKRLLGPIDELRAVSLVDFRRMAKTSELSVEKILNLVRLVEEQGYEKRVEAIRAWQSSPLYQQYLQIMRTAMQEGKPLEDARTAMAKTAETLTKEELAAVLTLNGELRF